MPKIHKFTNSARHITAGRAVRCARAMQELTAMRGQHCYWSLALPAEAPLEHNFRYPRIRELSVMGGAIALGAPAPFDTPHDR